MKKRILSLLLVLLMVVSLVPTAALATASNDYTKWKQYDSEWNQSEAWPESQYPYATMRWMRQAGCYVTSIAMLLRHYNVVTDSNVNNFNPWICNTELGKVGALDAAADMVAGNISKAYPGFVYAGSTTYSASTLVSLYNNGYACVVRVTNGENTHFVAVKTANSTDNIIIMDPGSESTSLSRYGSINGIIYFSVKSAGPHTHDKGQFMFYEADHPHHDCYKCSICGKVWADTNSSRLLDSCSECHPTSVKERVTHGYSVKISANYLLKNYTSELDTNAESKNYVLKKDKAYSLSCSEKVVLSNGTVRYKWVSGDTPPKTLWFEYDSSVMSVSLRHQYTAEYNYEAAHPHKYYKKCACGEFYYTGETEKLASCPECNPIGPVTYAVTGGNITFDKATGTITDCDDTVTEANIPSKIAGVAVTSIGDRAFEDCINIKRIEIPDSVTNIGEYAFLYCYNLISITLPNKLISISDGLLARCESLTSVTIPSSVTSIGKEIFYSCKNLTSITIPNGVTSINDSAFRFCRSLTSVTIPNSVTIIADCAFEGCSRLSNIKIPDSVTSIGNHAFYECSSLSSINIPDSVTSIGYTAFADCDSLTNVILPNSVTNISTSLFAGCTGLKSITIPNSVTSIDGNAFSGCTSLKSINVANTNTAYCSVNGVLFNKDKIELIIYPGGKTEASYTIPNSVTSIGDSAFSRCTNLKSVAIPDSVTSIGDWAFSHCTNLKSVAIPDSVKSIGKYAFYDCTNMTDVYYSGSETQWKNISGVDSCFDGVIIHFAQEEHTHSYTAVVIAPTCTAAGFTTYTCSCGNSYKDTYVDALGHNYVSGVCTRCNAKDPNYQVPHAHSYTAAVTAPTCTAAGYTTHTCSCGDSYKDNYVNALGHNYVNGACTRCGAKDPNYKPAVSFIDVPSDAFYANAVKWAVENEITTGVGNNRFDPNGQCTRGQVVTFLWRAAGKPTVSANVSFSDVQPGAFYYEAVKWAVANGITTGVGGNRFAPNDTCTRGQVVTFLHRAANNPAASTISSFTDVPSTAFYYNAVNWAVANGITNGTGNGRFSPNDTCTRAQVVTFLYRAQ